MSNLVENLNYAFHSESIAYKNMTLRMAANEIERLQAQVAALREALQWYVDNDDTNEGGDWEKVNSFWLEGRNRAIALLAAPVNGARDDPLLFKIEKLRKALEPFVAAYSDYMDSHEPDDFFDDTCTADAIYQWALHMTWGDLRRARAALEDKG